MSSLKSINIHKLSGSGIEKVSLTFLTASPQTANKQLFLNHCPGRKGEARVRKEDFYHFVPNYYEKSDAVHSLGVVDDSTPFQLAHFWL